jgi:hypothetical protein
MGDKEVPSVVYGSSKSWVVKVSVEYFHLLEDATLIIDFHDMYILLW